MRISLTQRCNFDCFFCHHEGEHDSGQELTADEIEEIIKITSDQGIRYVKLTGGEPLIRDDIVEIVRRIKPYVEEVSMTTNASRLSEKACQLKEAGLDRVNISLHSLDPVEFKEITGRDKKEVVKAGIREAIMCGLTPVKINMVVMKGLNHNEIHKFIEFSSETSAILQLIEFQELEDGVKHYDKYHFDLVPMEKMLSDRSKDIVEREMHRRKIYHLENGAQVEIVRPMHNTTFCRHCTRLRVSSDGKLKPCLMREDNHVPFVSLMRNGATQGELIEAFMEAVNRREPFWREGK